MPTARPLASLLLVVAIAPLAGCPSPKPDGKFDDFLDRTEEEREDAMNVKMDQGGALADINGTFLLALASFLSPPTPLQYFTTVTFEENPDGSGGTMSLMLQPLSLDPGQTTTPRQPVGEVLEIVDVPVSADGAFTIDVMEMIEIPGEANPITGSPIVVDRLILDGSIQSEDVFCGIADGHVLSPLDTPLTGSTFAAERVPAIDMLPLEVLGACPMGGADTGGTDGGTGDTTGGGTTGG